MEFCVITPDRIEELKDLQRQYKAEIGENEPTDADFERLLAAMKAESITFFGCVCDGKLVACCSVSKTFSTFCYALSGVMEDVFILPVYRKRGILRQLVKYAFENSEIESMTVGSADCDLAMYRAIGFQIPIGNLLAYGE